MRGPSRSEGLTDAINDCLNFNEAALRERRHGKAGAGRERRRHKGFHGFVDSIEIGHIGKEDRYFDDIGHRETGFRDDCAQILEGLRCLFFNAVSQFSRGRINAELP